MEPHLPRRSLLGLACMLLVSAPLVLGQADQASSPPRAFLDGTGPGWKALGEDDFAEVNCDPETWTWKDGVVHCTGQPVGVIRTEKPVTNFELVAAVAAPPIGRELGDLRLGPGEGARGHQARHRCRAGGSRCRSSTTATPSSTRSSPARRPTGSRPTATSSRSARRR